jgi:hypothetical protein
MAGDKDFSAVLDRLIAEVGPPDKINTATMGPSWWRRITRILASEQRGSRGHRITVSDPRLDPF